MKDKPSKKKILSSNVVDLSFLIENLSDDLDQLALMIHMFLGQSQDKVNLLKDSLLTKDYMTIKATSHFLKSSFTIMGLQSKELLSEIELLSSQSKEIEKITRLSNLVLINFDESVIEYKKILTTIQSKMKH